MSVEVKNFGITSDGRDVKQFVVNAGDKCIASFIELGGCIHKLCVQDRNGKLRDVVLGYDTVAEYEENPTFFGAILGRLISRMPDNVLRFEGKEYPLDNIEGMHMHGGVKGFSRVKWEGEVSGVNQITFSYLSPDGEEGYPGEVYAKVVYTVTEEGLKIDYNMSADTRTVINPSNHSYFNLNGHDGDSVRNHYLSCPVTGHFNQLTEQSTTLDYGADINNEVNLGELFALKAPSLEAMGGGLDHKFILKDASAEMKNSGILYSPESGIEMCCETTMPCVMIYSGNMVDNLNGKDGIKYQKHAGICFETMLFSSLHDMYGSRAIIEPGKPHKSTTVFKFRIR